MSSKWVTISFELVRLINRTCDLRTEVYTEPCETSNMELFCENSSFLPLIIFTKMLHLRSLLRSWICLCRSSHLRGIQERRCSEISSQNPWKITMKKFIFCKVAGWQSATFSRIPWGFYLKRNLWKLCFLLVLLLGKSFRERDCATLLKRNFFKGIFQEFWWKISPGNFQNSCL